MKSRDFFMMGPVPSTVDRYVLSVFIVFALLFSVLMWFTHPFEHIVLRLLGLGSCVVVFPMFMVIANTGAFMLSDNASSQWMVECRARLLRWTQHAAEASGAFVLLDVTLRCWL